MTTLTLAYRHITAKTKFGNLPIIPWKYIAFFGALSLTGMLVLYVISVNQLTMGTYSIKNYDKQIAQLTKENKVLETSFAESEFLGNVQKRVKELHFEKTTAVTYVKILEGSLGLAK